MGELHCWIPCKCYAKNFTFILFYLIPNLSCETGIIFIGWPDTQRGTWVYLNIYWKDMEELGCELRSQNSVFLCTKLSSNKICYIVLDLIALKLWHSKCKFKGFPLWLQHFWEYGMILCIHWSEMKKRNIETAVSNFKMFTSMYEWKSFLSAIM